MCEKQISISQVQAEAFFVRDDSLKSLDAPFYAWLSEHGFKLAWHKGHFMICDWVYVNITNKLFAYGMPGVKVVNAIGNHAISIEDFMTIYGIYEKYLQYDFMVLSEEEQKERNTKCYIVDVAENSNRKGIIDLIESNGFSINLRDGIDRESIISSNYPFIITMTDKTYTITQDTNLLAKKKRNILGEKEIVVYFKGEKCSYEEYYDAVKYIFSGMMKGVSKERIDRIIIEGSNTIKNGYERYISNQDGISPYKIAERFYWEEL